MRWAMTSVSVSLLKDDAFAPELPLEDGVVLDDAVMDHRDGAIVADVRMGVAIVGRPVRRPARVADAEAARRGLIARCLARSAMRPASCASADAPGQGRDAGAVVAAIFEPAEVLQPRSAPLHVAPIYPMIPHIATPPNLRSHPILLAVHPMRVSTANDARSQQQFG